MSVTALRELIHPGRSEGLRTHADSLNVLWHEAPERRHVKETGRALAVVEFDFWRER